jgi:hypothetical protein
MFFSKTSSDLKLIRRQRIRSIVNLSLLTDTHSFDELQDRNSAAYRELVSLIRGLIKQEDS